MHQSWPEKDVSFPLVLPPPDFHGAHGASTYLDSPLPSFPSSPQFGIVASGERAGETVIRVSERFFRPAEVELLLGDPSKV